MHMPPHVHGCFGAVLTLFLGQQDWHLILNKFPLKGQNRPTPVPALVLSTNLVKTPLGQSPNSKLINVVKILNDPKNLDKASVVSHSA